MRASHIHIALTLLLIFAIHAFAQNPPQAGGNPAYAVVPSVTFSLDFPKADPSHYSIVVASDGRATYSADPIAEEQTGVPYTYQFTMSSASRDKIFNTVPKLKYFNEDFDFKKGKVAFTGNKTLAYKDANRDFHSSYNWSSNTMVQDLTNLFEAIGETMQFARQLTYYHKHDKLGLEEQLKRLEEMQRDHEVAEVQALAPILQSIAQDGSVMNISRRRAEAILNTAQPAAP